MTTISREDVIRANPLLPYLSSLGLKINGSGNERTTNVCALTSHKPKHQCVSINVPDEIWFCNDCGKGGSVIDWKAFESNRSPNEVFKEMAMSLGGGQKNGPKPIVARLAPPEEEGDEPESRLVKTYDYTNEVGKLLYQACRYVPKSFRQRQPDGKGGWKWDMKDATRVLYNLPKICGSSEVVVVEGEKDADTLNKLGFAATTNIGGSKNWLAAYADVLKNKDVIVVPDQDEAGEKHCQAVTDSLQGKANSVKVVKLPVKDSTDWFETFKTPDEARAAFRNLFDSTPHFIPPPPVYTADEMERRYHANFNSPHAFSLDLSKFIPGFGRHVRPILPGEMIAVLAATGVGKTAIAQSIARCASPLPTLFFEMELPMDLLFERFCQMENNFCEAWEVQHHYKRNKPGLASQFTGLKHIIVCDLSGISPAKLEEIIEKSELKFGEKPRLVVVDYLGLMRLAGSQSRYQSVSDCAEQLRVIAKKRNVIILLTVQISRPHKDGDDEVGLNDGKDSGSIENSASLVIGAWKTSPTDMTLKILKNTKGRSGPEIYCTYEGERMKITERPAVAACDMPTISQNSKTITATHNDP